MTWWTEDGHVTLPKPVLDHMAEGAMALREEVVEEVTYDDPDLHPRVGIPVFDSLDPKTQVFALACVLRHLSDPNLPSPELFAWNEGTAYAMFVKAWQELGMEFEFERSPDAEKDLKFRFRRLIRDALRAVDPRADCPPVRSRDLDAWKDCLDEIAEHLFWDHDFLEEEAFADLDPTRAASLKKRLRIDDAYFSSPPPLVREEDYREADRFLRQVAGYSELLDPWSGEGCR